MRGLRRGGGTQGGIARLASLAAMLVAAGCSRAPLPLVVIAAPDGANAAALAQCLARSWEGEGFGVRVLADGPGWRVEAFGMPPSIRAAGRVPPRLAAEIQPSPDGAPRASLLAAPTLFGARRVAEEFSSRVAECGTGASRP